MASFLSFEDVKCLQLLLTRGNFTCFGKAWWLKHPHLDVKLTVWKRFFWVISSEVNLREVGEEFKNTMTSDSWHPIIIMPVPALSFWVFVDVFFTSLRWLDRLVEGKCWSEKNRAIPKYTSYIYWCSSTWEFQWLPWFLNLRSFSLYFDLSMVLSYVCLMCQIQPCSMCDLCEGICL